MTQQINLFVHMPKDEEDNHPVSTDLIRKLALWILIGLVVLAALQVVSYANAWRVLTSLERQTSIAQKSLDALKAQYPDETQLSLQSMGQQVEEEIKSKQQLLEVLKGQERDTQPFSRPLESLSQQIVEGVWLTSIEIDHEAELYRFVGNAFSVDRVLVFIKNLSEDGFFKDKDFKVFEVSNPSGDQKFIQFILSTNE